MSLQCYCNQEKHTRIYLDNKHACHFNPKKDENASNIFFTEAWEELSAPPEGSVEYQIGESFNITVFVVKEVWDVFFNI